MSCKENGRTAARLHLEYLLWAMIVTIKPKHDSGPLHRVRALLMKMMLNLLDKYGASGIMFTLKKDHVWYH